MGIHNFGNICKQGHVCQAKGRNQGKPQYPFHPWNKQTIQNFDAYVPAVIRKCWARDGKWKAPWLHGQQLHYFQRWCFGLHSLFCKGPFQSSTSGWTSMNCWWIGPGWRSSPQQNMNHECCSWRERSTSQLIGYLDALFASSLSHRSLWLCQPVK